MNGRKHEFDNKSMNLYLSLGNICLKQKYERKKRKKKNVEKSVAMKRNGRARQTNRQCIVSAEFVMTQCIPMHFILLEIHRKFCWMSEAVNLTFHSVIRFLINVQFVSLDEWKDQEPSFVVFV